MYDYSKQPDLCNAPGIFQDDSKKYVAMVTEDKRVVTTDGEVTVAKVARRGYSILTIYEHAL